MPSEPPRGPAASGRASRRWRGARALLAASLLSASASADPQGERKAAHLLGYVAVDYGGAVRDGKVLDQAELDEQIALLNEASSLVASASPGVRRAVERARAIAASKGSAAELAPLARGAAEALLAGRAGAPLAPSIERGRAVFSRACASCHGDDGSAQTPLAAQLRPRPADLQDPTLAEELSPARVALAVEFGVPGTAMVPRDDLSPQDRVDAAFFAVSLAFAGVGAAEGPPLSVDELASNTNRELREGLARGGAQVERIEAMIARYRRDIPYIAPSPEGRARALLRRARALSAVDEGEARAARAEAAAALGEAGGGLAPGAERLRQRLLAGEAAEGGELWEAPRAPGPGRGWLWAAPVAAALAALLGWQIKKKLG